MTKYNHYVCNNLKYKDGGSPVTIADREIDQLLSQILPEPSDGWLSEESLDSDERLSYSRVWVVDPIDGTRSFAAGRSDYSVSIALLVDGQPVLGAVGAPSHDVQIVHRHISLPNIGDFEAFRNAK